MKKIKTVMEWTTAVIVTAGAIAGLRNDRRIHSGHGEHNPCDCRSSCLSCLRS
jgi:hypothetical protein